MGQGSWRLYPIGGLLEKADIFQGNRVTVGNVKFGVLGDYLAIALINWRGEQRLSQHINYLCWIASTLPCQAERFRRGKTPIEGKIDLHGRTQAQAHDDLHDFVARAHAAGKRMVLVITGKGMTASKSGVLKENVPRWLNEPGLRRHVLAFDYAEPQHGGEGALYVLLKRKKDDRA